MTKLRTKLTRAGGAGLFIVLVAAWPFAWPAPASATTPQDVRFELETTIPGVGGMFSVSGAISDSGAFALAPVTFGGGLSAIGTAHVVVTLTGDSGTMTVRVQALFTPTADPNVLATTGRWVVVGGTGAYARLEGAGAVAGSFDLATFTGSDVWEGRVHFD